jgi:hypothetical protein
MDRKSKSLKGKTWIARVLIGLVLLDNLQAAVIFLVLPSRISPSFELNGVASNAAIQGIGLLFLMWCVPYFVAALDPGKHKISFIESIIMQVIALIGEFILLVLLPTKLPILTSSVQRFILFDGIGLLFLLFAAAVLWFPRKSG